jgi:hypothetical protein
MHTRYVDPYVVCPFYSYDEVSTVRKIHCEGYKKGVYVQMFFKTKGLKKKHKKCFCNNQDGYQKCPLYRGSLEYYKENDDE